MGNRLPLVAPLPMTRSARLLFGLLTVACASPLVRADNGAVSYAVPATDLVADGSLDDWPASVRPHRLELRYFGNEPQSFEDCDATFLVAYEPGTPFLYVAVEVEDESHQVEAPGRDWWNDDSCVVYFDRTHARAGSGSAAYAIAGSRRELSGNAGIPWDPAVTEQGWSNATGALTREGTRTVYEFAIDTGTTLAPGQTFGLDVVVIDLDEGEADEDGSYLCFGPFVSKNRTAGRCGSLLLLPEDAELGTLTGTVTWDAPREAAPACVRVTSLEDEDQWLDVALDANRRFEAELLPGRYRIEPQVRVLEAANDWIRIADDPGVEAEVVAWERSEAKPLVLRARPEPTFPDEGGMLAAFEEPDAEAVDRFMDAWMDHYGIPGASLAIVSGGERVYARNFGVTNALTAEPVTDDTLFEAASITKCVFAFAVMRLVEEGVVDLDRPLWLDLPFPALEHDERHKLLTARIVLNHQSGLPNWGPREEGSRISFRFTPGTSYGYSGEAIEYLSRVVAKLDGRSVDEILREEALEPMGFVGRTRFHDDPAMRALVARGHWPSGPTKGDIPAETGVAHSMYSNAHELSAFLTSLLAGRGLSPEAYLDLFELTVARPAGEIAPRMPWRKGFGLGFMVMESPHGLVFGHDGNNGDFRANLEAYRDLDAGYVLFVNHSLGGELSNRLRGFLLPADAK